MVHKTLDSQTLALKNIRCVIFDLDDTLFDTYGLLVKPATREACQAMIGAGLNGDIGTCIEMREKLFLEKPRADVYDEIVKLCGVKKGIDPKKVAAAGFNAFHDRDIKETIFPFEDALETLNTLRPRFNLTLVTLGTPKTQLKKVQLLQLTSCFDSIVYVNVVRERTKTGAFKETMVKFPRLKPENFVSIGNRLDTDIRAARELGMRAILMRHGEYLHLEPKDALEIPDAAISKLRELTCILPMAGPG